MDRNEFDSVFAQLYSELSDVARAQRGRWRGNETLNTTVLVHEAYLKMSTGQTSPESRKHFFALAAQVMRQVLVNYAEARQAAKRGGNVEHVSLETEQAEFGRTLLETDAQTDELLQLNDALKELAKFNQRQADIVECRFFAGLPISETADALGISPATVKREWQSASEWLRQRMTQ